MPRGRRVAEADLEGAEVGVAVQEVAVVIQTHCPPIWQQGMASTDANHDFANLDTQRVSH